MSRTYIVFAQSYNPREQDNLDFNQLT